MKIWANTIVNNEENFIWFSIMSVIDYVDKILIYDTGSIDKTVEIIKEIQKLKGDKVYFEQFSDVDKYGFTKLRQKMLEESRCDWILILDGDEIWWESSIKKVLNEIKTKKDNIEGIVVPFVVPIGDIYHFQDESAGRYKIVGRKGHLNLRAINKHIKGVHVGLPYGKEGFFDSEEKLIQERDRIVFLNAPYFHTTHLKRSYLNRKYNKEKYELGNKFSSTFKFPEVFYKDYPVLVSSPWVKISGIKKIYSKILTPFRKIKRGVLK